MTDEHGPDIPEQRKYLPTLAELIDRLSIVQLKMIFIGDNREFYEKERADIEHDLTMTMDRWQKVFSGLDIRAILILMLTNRYIWENESKARAGGPEQDKLLKLTHSVNGIRSQAKNIIARSMGERVDLKTDCFAAELEKEFGNWNVFNDA